VVELIHEPISLLMTVLMVSIESGVNEENMPEILEERYYEVKLKSSWNKLA